MVWCVDMLIDIDKIIVNDRIRHDYGDLDELAEDIKANGLINPPVVNKAYGLLAGERRLRACKLLGWPTIEVRMIDTRDAEHELNIEISENDVRKGFTKSERVDYMKRLLRIEQAKAKERQDLGLKSDEGSRADDATAKQFGIGRDTMRREMEIADNRDLLDPADFADWDEGRLSTNKAFQRVKAAKERAERELADAKKRAERELRQASIEVTDAKMEAESLKKQVSVARAEVRALEQQNDKLYAQKNPKPQIVERTVVHEVESEESKRRIAELEHLERVHCDDNQKLRRQLESTRKELDRAKVLLKEKGHEDNASWDISALTTATNQYLRSYGGKAWAFDQFYRVDEVTQAEFTKAITSLAAFSQNLVQMISDQNKLGA